MFLIRGYFAQILEGVLSRRCFVEGVLSEGVLDVYKNFLPPKIFTPQKFFGLAKFFLPI